MEESLDDPSSYHYCYQYCYGLVSVTMSSYRMSVDVVVANNNLYHGSKESWPKRLFPKSGKFETELYYQGEGG